MLPEGSLKILRIDFENLRFYKDGKLSLDFYATDRVSDTDQVYNLYKSLYVQKLISFIGINASGKTATLNLIDFVLDIIINNRDLNSIQVKENLFEETFKLTAYFVYDEKIYEWKATIGKNGKPNNQNKALRLYFIDELVKAKSLAKIKTKKDVFLFSEKDIFINRRNLGDSSAFLKDDASVLLGVTKRNKVVFSQLINYTNANVFFNTNIKPTYIEDLASVFDPSIEKLSCEYNEDTVHYKLKFKNQNPLNINDPFSLGDIVSSGTIKGQNMLSYIVDVLKSGGYIIVDELENHFNKELVKTIMNLFLSPKTNPHGACMIFSTHYTELLDFLDRKDNIFVTRKINPDNNEIDVVKYAAEYKRADVKKSEVIFANIIKGSVPQYENLQKLRKYICQIL